MLGMLATVCLGLMACSSVPFSDEIASQAFGEIAQPPQNSTETRVTFKGETPPWADDAAAVMTELENWRGKSFSETLQVTFQPQDEPDLNGWYNSETKELVVTTDGSDKMGRGVLLHEIFHALQDQNFDLYQLRLARFEQPDTNQALSAIIEGEAMLAVSELLNYNFLDHARLSAEGEINEDYFEKLFLYGDGLKFIEAVRDEGGWAAVDAVFENLPQSTALILNPERYVAGEREVETLEVPLQPGEKLVSETERGAYGVQLLIAQAEETRSQLNEFAQHYRGDRLATIQTESDANLHRWAIRFDSPKVALQRSIELKTALSNTDKATASLTVSVENDIVTAQW